jgi:hypothetical protein
VTDSNSSTEELARALDAALSRTLRSPRPPLHLTLRVRAAIAQAKDSPLADVRLRFEREQRQKLAELKEQYVWMRRRTLGVMVGGAFAAGAVAALAMPWLTASLGPAAPALVASAGAAVGLWIGVSSWLAARRGHLA